MNKNNNTIRRQVLGVLTSLATTVAPVLSYADDGTSPHARALAKALDLARSDNWGTADIAASVAGQTARDIIEWHRLREGEGSFDRYRTFLKRNPDWPGLVLLRQMGESAITHDTDPDDIIRYFEGGLPRTGIGSYRLISALSALGMTDLATTELRLSWVTKDLSEKEEATFLRAFGRTLQPWHFERVDHLIWNGRFTAAARLLDLLPPAEQALAKARLGLRRNQQGVDALVAAIPAPLATDPGLAYDRFRWRLKNTSRASALEILLQASTSAERLGEPGKWANQRQWLARDLMRDGHPKTAYKVASQHFLSEGTQYSDLEWLAGFIALTDLNDPETALFHFRRLRANVSSPISLGRAGYWEGRAYDRLGQSENARAAYALAAEFQTSFYGQLAAEKIGATPNARLTGKDRYPNPIVGDLAVSSVLQAALLLNEAGEEALFRRFLRHLVETLSEDQRGGIGDLALDANSAYSALYVAKYAASEGQVLIPSYYPLPTWADRDFESPDELVLSIARRESEFNVAARSSVGARGLMQLMPATARETAAKHGISMHTGNLTKDASLNLHLGDLYLQELLQDFDGYLPFVLIGYNAGPARVEQWVDRLGKPGQSVEDVIDWIEHIPFSETRNYVMRVSESVFVYQARLSGTLPEFVLSDILTGKWPH